MLTLKFFPLQAVGITFEDFFIYITKRLFLMREIEFCPGQADESWAKAVVSAMGYCWVVL